MNFAKGIFGGDKMQGLLRYEQAADYLGIEIPTVKKWVKEGKLPYVKISRKCTRFKKVDLDKFIESARVEAA